MIRLLHTTVIVFACYTSVHAGLQDRAEFAGQRGLLLGRQRRLGRCQVRENPVRRCSMRPGDTTI